MFAAIRYVNIARQIERNGVRHLDGAFAEDAQQVSCRGIVDLDVVPAVIADENMSLCVDSHTKRFVQALDFTLRHHEYVIDKQGADSGIGDVIAADGRRGCGQAIDTGGRVFQGQRVRWRFCTTTIVLIINK